MANRSEILAGEILELITKRYVVNDLAIPASVLKLKDEAMTLYAKVRKKPEGSFPAEYERRLSEIKETLEKGER